MDPACWNILIVDDDEDDFILVRHMLSEAKRGGYTLQWARSYEEGLRLILAGGYDIILMDYDLGGNTGLELTRKVVQSGSHIPIILFTGRGSYEIDLEAMEAGTTLYLTKSETSALMLERSIRYAIEHKNIEQKLRQSEARYRTILKTLPVGISVLDSQARLVENNALAAQIWGSGSSPPSEETVNPDDPNPPAESTGLQESVAALVLDGQDFQSQEVTLQHPDGTSLPALVSASPINDSSGMLVGVVVAAVDISTYQCLQEELKQSEKKYRELIRYAPAGIYEVDFRTKRIVTVNEAMCELSGYSREELINMNPFDLLDDEGKILFAERIKRWLAGEEPEKNVEYKVKTKSGKTIHAILNTNFTKDQEGRPLGATVIGFDITERKHAEEILRRNAGRNAFRLELSDVLRPLTTTQAIKAAAAQVIGRHLTASRVTFAERVPGNDEWFLESGYTDGVEAIQGRCRLGEYCCLPVENHYSGRTSVLQDISTDPQITDALKTTCKEKGVIARVDVPLIKDGQLKMLLSVQQAAPRQWTEDEVSLVEEAAERVWAALEQARVEEELRQSQEHMSRLVNTSYEGIWSVDQTGKTTFVNQRAAEILGYRVEEIQGQNAFQFLMAGDVEQGRQTLADIAAGKSGRVEGHARHKDGSEAWLLVSYSPIVNDQGKFQGALAMFSDITERKQMEKALNIYTEQLKRSNQELEDFAFMASHDLQEPLRKIVSFSKQLAVRAGPALGEMELDYLNRMAGAAVRMSRMIDDLLALSRVTSRGLPFTSVDLNQVARAVLDDLEIQIRQTAGQVEIDELPVIQADPIQIHQLFQNLISNALKFHQPGVHPEVKILSRRTLDHQLEICVQDNGIGFDMSQTSRLFQPFQRLHGRSEYEGTGVGLSICKKIVERHGGSITAAGAPGSGAVFTIILPAG